MIVSSILAFLAPMVGFMPAEKKAAPLAGTKNPLDIDNMIAFLESKNPTESYNFFFAESCLVAQFGEYCGLGKGIDAYFAITGGRPENEPFRSKISGGSIACRAPWTYGAALQRAKLYKTGMYL